MMTYAWLPAKGNFFSSSFSSSSPKHAFTRGRRMRFVFTLNLGRFQKREKKMSFIVFLLLLLSLLFSRTEDTAWVRPVHVAQGQP